MSKNKADLIQKTHIIHVIGAVGAGKSKFRRNYLQDVPTFDIQEIYSKEG
ncbi:MAG: hypothetical protein ACTSWL_10555 [Promethearchaeota archaeon]